MNSLLSFEELIKPLNWSKFLNEFFDKKHFHQSSMPERFHPLFTSSFLMESLEIKPLWNQENLKLYNQGVPVSYHTFCTPYLTLDQGAVLKPNRAHIKALLEKGATLVANDIGSLTPALREISQEFSQALEAHTQANLYYSIKSYPGFLSHFDVHDVFVFHLEGQKKWRLYEGRAVSPINHPLFNSLSQEVHESQKGTVLTEITLKPGDFLYVPRGMYHDALALTDHSLHITLGVTRPIGLKVLSLLFEAFVYEPLGRQNLPSINDPLAFSIYLKALGERASEVFNDPHFQQQLKSTLASEIEK